MVTTQIPNLSFGEGRGQVQTRFVRHLLCPGHDEMIQPQGNGGSQRGCPLVCRTHEFDFVYPPDHASSCRTESSIAHPQSKLQNVPANCDSIDLERTPVQLFKENITQKVLTLHTTEGVVVIITNAHQLVLRHRAVENPMTLATSGRKRISDKVIRCCSDLSFRLLLFLGWRRFVDSKLLISPVNC